MDFVLVNPPLRPEDLYHNLSEGGSELPPLGICSIAAILREGGYSAAVVDAMALRLDSSKTVEQVRRLRPKYVGISTTTMSVSTAAEVAHLCKKEGVTTILGGPHVTAVPEETFLRYPQFDIGVIGEGEDTVLELAHALEAGKDLAEVPGLLLRRSNKLQLTPPRPFIKDLDKIPLPAWDLLPDIATHYQPAADSLYRFPASSLVTSRGCSGKCVFCDQKVFGGSCRAFSADYVIRMMKVLRDRFGIRDLFIHDDNFLMFYKRTQEICRLIISENIDITWSCLGRTDQVDWSILPLMKKAGCWQINYGLESGSQEILDLIVKGTTIEAMTEAVRRTREAGIRVKGLFMIGCFGETRETIAATNRYIKSLDLDDFHMTCFTPLPGSRAFSIAHTYGDFDPNWDKMNMFSAESFIPHGFTRQEIERAYRRAYRIFYFRPRIVLYYLAKFNSWAMAKKLLRSAWALIRFTAKKVITE